MSDREFYCPVLATLNVMNQRWSLHILRSLLESPKRFNELSRENGINPRTLQTRLIALEAQGLIERNVLSQHPPAVEYRLTEKGRDLNDVFEVISSWGRRWMCPD